MKMIVAYVRSEMITHVVEALASAGCLDFTVLEARRVVAGLRGESYGFSLILGERFETVQKLEIVCRAELARPWADVIRGAAHTGRHGDGAIFILAVEEAMKVSDGTVGRGALMAAPPDQQSR